MYVKILKITTKKENVTSQQSLTIRLLICQQQNTKSSRTCTIYKKKKLRHFYFFITHSYFAVPKDVRRKSTHFFIFPNKRKLEEISINNSSDNDYKDFINLYKKFKTMFLLIDCYYSYVRQSLTFQRECFRKNIKTNHDN